ncbi:MAG: hypothetical protein H8M99_03570 [Gloeobacteraceae cyanobacterium ES-bin-144]|nr:hypothetical protein [Verrucomicrobiales bacterium]
MNFRSTLIAFTLVANLTAAEVPTIFTGLFQQDIPVKAQIGMVRPPQEIDKYIGKVEAAARKDPKWFQEYSAKAKPGVPLPFDERIGLTKQEYDEYIALWAKREFRGSEDIMLLLRQSAGGTWTINATGGASGVSTLRYNPKSDSFSSPNGEMKRIADIKSDASSIFGEWTGSEWKFEEETGLGKTKENIAVGRFADNKYGIIIYRVIELSTEGARLLDKSIVIRFPLGKSTAVAKETKPTPAKETTPAPVRVTPKKPAPKK